MRRLRLSRPFLVYVLTILAGIAAPERDAAAEEAAPDAATTRELPGPSNLLGQRGVLRTAAARPQPKGTFDLGAGVQYYSTRDLFPVGDGTKADHERVVTTYALNWAVFSFLEAALAIHVAADNSTGPTVDDLQVAVGDPELALKSGWSLGSGFDLGALLDLRLPSADGFFKISGSAINVMLAALASWTGTQRLPLAAHVNFGLLFDNSENIFDNPETLTAAQRYSAQVSSFNRLIARAGVEYITRYVGPFAELSFEPLLGSGAPGFGDSPGTLSLGVRGWLGERRGLQLLAAIDLGLTGVGDGTDFGVPAGKYIAPIPRWNLALRLSYRFDPFAPPAVRVVREVTEGPPPPPIKEQTSNVRGRIVDDRTGTPIWDARVAVAGRDASPQAVDPKTGSFTTYGLPLGPQTLIGSANGYADATSSVDLTEGGAEITIRLKRKVRVQPGTLRGIVSARGGAPLSNARALLPAIDRVLTVDTSGNFSVELKPGPYIVVVSAPGYRTQRKKVRVFEGSTVILNVELYR